MVLEPDFEVLQQQPNLKSDLTPVSKRIPFGDTDNYWEKGCVRSEVYFFGFLSFWVWKLRKWHSEKYLAS